METAIASVAIQSGLSHPFSSASAATISPNSLY